MRINYIVGGMAMEKQTYANSEVLEFYKELPFNYKLSVKEHVNAIRKQDAVAAYPALAFLLEPGVSVLEVGCGAGWLSNNMAYHYSTSVDGIDFNPVVIERARKVAEAMKLKTSFHVADLFLYEPETQYDIVVSLGVLHHTNNCQAAIQRLCKDFVRPGGYVMIGLYHVYGRQPFLDHFDEMKAVGATEEEMLTRYRELHSILNDEVHLASWFRDQVLHPHETQHTLKEIAPILKELGMELISTSINQFDPIESLEKLFDEEKKYHDLAVQRLQQNQYFPGFFVFLAQRKDIWQ